MMKFVVEGYLWEFPETIEAIAKVCEAAHRNGNLVAITTSDVSCVMRHEKKFLDIIVNQADIVFENNDEVQYLSGFCTSISPEMVKRYLSHSSSLVSIRDGIRGSYLAVKGECMYIPPLPYIPVGTCGTNDAYAVGILYRLSKESSNLKAMGDLAARVGAIVVGQQGTRLKEENSSEIVETFSHSLPIENWIMDNHSHSESDQISSI